MSPTQPSDKQAMAALKQERSFYIERARNTIKVQAREIKAIRTSLKDGGRTVPEIAAALCLPSERVLMYVATLKKYGQIAEGPKDGDYFKYVLVSA